MSRGKKGERKDVLHEIVELRDALDGCTLALDETGHGRDGVEGARLEAHEVPLERRHGELALGHRSRKALGELVELPRREPGRAQSGARKGERRRRAAAISLRER